MKSIKLFSLMVITALHFAITQHVWAIDYDFAVANMPLVEKYLSGQLEASSNEKLEKINRLKCQAFVMDAKTKSVKKADNTYQSTSEVFDAAEPGSVAIIPIQGAIMKADYCGWPGTETLAQWTQEADAHPNIIGIIHLTKSPGGSTDAMFQMADATKAINKPILNFAQGLCASAAMCIASAANERWADHPSTLIGSIGTMCRLTDNTDYYAKMGIKEHVINADSSPDKNTDFTLAKKGNYTLLKQNLLNPTNDLFLSYMRANLDGTLQEGEVVGEGLPGEPLTGKVYLAQAAKVFGLVDQIGTLNAAVERVKQMADSNYKVKLV